MLGQIAIRFQRSDLDATAVLRQAFRLHRRLLGKTLVVAFAVFAPFEILPAVAFGRLPVLPFVVVALTASFAGSALVQ